MCIAWATCEIIGATIHHGEWSASDADLVVGGILPSHRIMPHVDVAITMGGQGSVQTAMASGTPLIGIPLHPEQELNVALAARQGMAVALAPRHVATPAMTQALRRIPAQPSFKTQALRTRQLYAGIDGARHAADAIRNHLRSAASAAAAGPNPPVHAALPA